MAEVSDELLRHGERLLVDAFEQARASGRSDWKRMTTAVLKNRLLTMTSREFSEQLWGVGTFSEFLRLFPGVVSVDTSTRPPTAEFLSGHEETTSIQTLSERPMTREQRIRPDLWSAVLDLSEETAYVWDEISQAVVSAEAGEGSRPHLPKVDRETFAAWRDRFAQEHLKLVPPRVAAAIERWRDEQTGSANLPPPIRGLWNADLKRRVAEILEAWFEEQNLSVPHDLVEATNLAGRSTPGDTERLRELIHRTVRVMTREELEEVKLPAAAVLRARGST